MTKAIVAQLSKAPVPGQVKTRMLTQLSPQNAMKLHTAMTEYLVQRLAGCALYDYELWISKPHLFFSSLTQCYSLQLCQQRTGSLGARLSHIASVHKHRPLILIGSDCPAIDKKTITEALQLINDKADVVLIPARDGGYVLLGCRRHWPELYENIEWGTENVFQQTLNRAEQLQLKTAQLPLMDDIDHPEDIEKLSQLPGFNSLLDIDTLLPKPR